MCMYGYFFEDDLGKVFYAFIQQKAAAEEVLHHLQLTVHAC